jgi:hypothetical protein
MTDVQIDPALEVEAEPETDGEPDAPVELPGPDVDGPADDDGAEDDDAEGEQEGEQGEPEQGDEQARQQAAMNEQELERLHGKLTKANEAHARKVGTIMGEDATSLIPCPVCSDFVAGAIFPPEVAPLPEHVKERMQQLLGLNNWEDIPAVAWARQCDDCKGHGEVKTGSTVIGKETTRCEKCGGDGWQNLRDPEGAAVKLAKIPTETGPTVYGQDTSNDPDVQYLRDKGYTVIPPMPVQQAG